MNKLSHGFADNHLNDAASCALEFCAKKGIDQAEVMLAGSDGISVNVRQGALESIENMREHTLTISVYKNLASASASTGDLSPAGIIAASERAVALVNFTQADSANGLAAAELMATTIPDLQLCSPWAIGIDAAIQIAMECEQAALDCAGISNSNGAELSSYQSAVVYANSHGFCGAYETSRHGLSCQVMAGKGDAMVRDYWYSSARDSRKLQSAASIGKRAAARVLARQNPRKLKTQRAKVLYAPLVASGLISHFLQAISGGNLYNRTSFLQDGIDTQIFNKIINMHDDPLQIGAIGSAPFDSEGMQTFGRDLIIDGVLQHYLLSSYSARRLGLPCTDNAGSVRNLKVAPSVAKNCEQMLADLDTGLLLTEFMGSSINSITGDYSRGAAGFWVENGQLQYPVAEITVAGNLKEMYQNILAVGIDEFAEGNIVCGAILLEGLTIAGQ